MNKTYRVPLPPEKRFLINNNKYLNCVLTGLCCAQMFTLAGLLHAEVVINELHYDPDIATEDVEFVELFNTGGTPVDLGGWRLKGGIDFAFAPGTTIATGGYLVICQDIPEFATKFGFSPLGPYSGRLNNDGDRVELVDAVGDLEDQVTYQLGFPWPTVGDAPGSSIELTHPTFDNSLGGSWRASSPSGPTPGARNSVFTNNIPPQIRQVKHSPSEPRSGEAVLISAKVTDSNGVSSVTLHYQLVNPGAYISTNDAAFETTWTSVAMNDLGTGGDAVAGDDVYSVELAAGLQVHRRLVRYRVTVTDGSGKSLRVPYADDPQPNFAYFVYDGVPAWQGSIQPGAEPAVTYSAAEMSRLPTYHLISKKTDVETATWFERYLGDEYKWLGTLVYDGVVYDHVHYRARGGVWRYAMVKNMWKVALNRGHELQARDNWGNKHPTRWRRLNLGASIQQGDQGFRGEQGMFEAVGHRLFDLAGADSPNTTFCTFRIVDEAGEVGPNQFEGDFWGLYLAVEELDGRYLDGSGLPAGNLYKMENGTGAGNGVLEHQGPDQPGDNSDLVSFVNGYNSYTDQQWRDNMNLPKYYSYQAMVQAIHHYDIAHGKNYFFFHNPDTGKWETLPWDFDLTWSDNQWVYGASGGAEPFRSRVLSDFSTSPARPAIYREFQNRVREIRDLLYNTDQAHRLLDEYASILRGTNTASILAADRAMWDYNPKMTSSTYSTDPDSKAGQGRFYRAGTPTRDFPGMVQLMKNYVVYRGGTADLSPAGGGLDGLARDTQIPSSAVVTSTGPGNFPVNKLTFRTTAYSGSNPFAAWKWRIAEVTPTNAPASLAESRKYEIEANWESPDITDLNALDISIPGEVVRPGRTYRVRVRSEDTTGRRSHWSPPLEFTSGEPDSAATLLANLRVSELMFNSPAGSEFDFVEVQNRSMTTALDLGGAKFTQGIDYTFPPGTVLAPGGYLVVAKTNNVANFRSHYGLAPSIRVLGGYDGNFSNGGESVVLRTSVGGTDIVAFTYSDDRGWPDAADGAGHSLVPLVTDDQTDGRLDYGGHWRASAFVDGSPGAPDPVPAREAVLNEVVAHTDLSDTNFPGYDSNDWLELFNLGTSALSLAGWYLSDDGDDLDKWAIPATNTLAPGAWIVFDEISGFHSPLTNGFGLNKAGETVFLSHLPGGGLDRVVDAVRFKGQENGASLGRYPDGGAWWYALAPTPWVANAAPTAGVVIGEFLYHPATTGDEALVEFVEVHNAGSVTAALWNADGVWRLDGGVRYTFPAGVTLAPEERLVVVGFDPVSNATTRANFLATYGLSEGQVRLYGPCDGQLDNRGERLALEKPLAPDTPTDPLVWVIVDEVIYFDRAPWTPAADGTGRSLARAEPAVSGRDPVNWYAAQPPTPGLSAGRIALATPEDGAVVFVQNDEPLWAVVDAALVAGPSPHVAFYVDATAAGTDATTPFTAVVRLPAAGRFALRAELTDAAGVWTSRTAWVTALALSNAVVTAVDDLAVTVQGGLEGPAPAAVWVHWGLSDGGTNPAAWAFSASVGTVSNATFRAQLDGLLAGRQYAVRFSAMVGARRGWSPATIFFTTWSYAEWPYRATIRFDGYTDVEPLADFPALVRFGTNIAGFAYSQFGGTWASLRFSDVAGATPLAYEVDVWDTNGESAVWVRVPALTNGTAIQAYWGLAGATNPPPTAAPGAVWQADDEAVWHWQDGWRDATWRGYEALNSGSMAAAGVVGAGRAFDGVDDAIALPLPPSWYGENLEAMTVSLWARPASPPHSFGTVWGSAELHVQMSTTPWVRKWAARVAGSYGLGPVYDDGAWQMISLVLSNGTAFLQKNNDAPVLLGAYTPFTPTNAPVLGRRTEGNLPYAGAIDEVRLSRAARSAAWLRATYLTVAQPATFTSFGPVITATGDADGDGLPDAWERQHFGDTSRDGAADWDGDGLSDANEYVAGTQPTNAASHFRLTMAGATNAVVMGFEAILGEPGSEGQVRFYRLEEATSLVPQAWRGLPGYTNLQGLQGDVRVTNPAAPGGKFYRGKVWLEPEP